VDWSNAWDLASLSAICDYLFLMGYDYYWSGSTTAGPVCPLEGENYNVTRSVTTYLSAGAAPEKLILGNAWYGLDWPVTSTARKAAASASASSGTYAVLEAKAKQYGKQFDTATKTPWFTYQSGTQWRQAWYDDSLSLAYKYALVKSKNLGGFGMWALSYEAGRQELWQGIRAGFAAAAVAEGTAVPSGYALEQNYPNPFNPATTIRYRVQAAAHVSVTVFDVLGKPVMTLVDGVKAPGTYSVEMDAHALPSGMYFCRMAAGPFTATTKLILQR
jgi:GH18 family chitinase